MSRKNGASHEMGKAGAGGGARGRLDIRSSGGVRVGAVNADRYEL